ncbi:MAG: FixH family protein [bacterium]|nr:FixH family protein [bacterium]
MFAIFVIANVVMIYLALHDSPGLVVDDYYDRGQDYEKNMLKRQALNPGWQLKVIAPEYVDVSVPSVFGLRTKDKDGKEFKPDSVTFYAYRPADSKQDFSVPMTLSQSGLYEAPISFPLLGVWDILISVQQGDIEINMSHRLSAGVK